MEPDATIVRLNEGGGVLAHTQSPAGAYLNTEAMRWLEDAFAGRLERALEDEERACVQAWSAAGLLRLRNADEVWEPEAARWVEDRDRQRGVVLAAAARVAVPRRVLVVAVSEECGFCAQLRANLLSYAKGCVWPSGASDFSVVLAGGEPPSLFGPPGDLNVSALERLATEAARLGTPTGVLLDTGKEPQLLSGYDEVTSLLLEELGAGKSVTVSEAVSSCSVNVVSQADTVCRAVACGQRILGVATRGDATVLLEEYLSLHAVDHGVFAPVTLTVERPHNLFLLYRGGSLIARLRTLEETISWLDALRNCYSDAASCSGDEVDVHSLALWHPGHGLLLVPLSWASEFARRARDLQAGGWVMCPDPYVRVSNSGECGRGCVHPVLDGVACVLEAPLAGVVLPSMPVAGEEARPAAPRAEFLTAQWVCWAARPVSPRQLEHLAEMAQHMPLVTSTAVDISKALRRRQKGLDDLLEAL
ncbi:hypothetical protein ACIBKX_37570 [Streptomyces sp. NPDC050658]|uniref:hypothetical protein n=1 Tax=unclassified Streptomyces TaxID=2593676 RepID=UPI00343C2498